MITVWIGSEKEMEKEKEKRIAPFSFSKCQKRAIFQMMHAHKLINHSYISIDETQKESSFFHFVTLFPAK